MERPLIHPSFLLFAPTCLVIAEYSISSFHRIVFWLHWSGFDKSHHQPSLRHSFSNYFDRRYRPKSAASDLCVECEGCPWRFGELNNLLFILDSRICWGINGWPGFTGLCCHKRCSKMRVHKCCAQLLTHEHCQSVCIIVF